MTLADRLKGISADLDAEIEDNTDRFDELLDELDDVAEQVAELESDTALTWNGWVERSLASIPGNASLGDSVKLKEILEKAVKEL